MKPSETNLQPLEIDVAQWRRDVQTFVDMTTSELSAINDQLAANFSGSNERRPAATGTESSELLKNQTTKSTLPSNGLQQSGTAERLSQLKQKLGVKRAVDEDAG